MTFPILSSLIALPIVGALLLLLVPDEARHGALVHQVALIVSVLVFAETVLLWTRFNPATADFQFVERHAWIPSFGISYAVGVDGISLLLLVLTGFLTPLALLSSWESVNRKTRAFCAFVLLLESAMMGVFVSLDLFLFYVFWDAMLIPMYFLIGIWGYDRRVYAAVKFILYTMAGSVLMLLAILALAYLHSVATGAYSFDLLRLYELQIPPQAQFWGFLAFALAFAIKVPLFPFHTWLPDAHVEAPTAGSVILAGVLLKMGTYGFIRFSLPFFPNVLSNPATFLGMTVRGWMIFLSIVGILYGALVSLMQKDMKKLVAYSSVSHLGFCTLGIFALTPLGLSGSVLQQINHGISTGALFLIVGILYERRHTREISEYGGISNVMPVYATITMIMFLSSMGLPLLNGFVGEFTILQGTFMENWKWGAWAVPGVVLAAAYLLWLYQRVFFGTVTNPKNEKLHDLTPREVATFVPLLIMAFWIGLYPKPFFQIIEQPVNHTIAIVRPDYPLPAANAAAQPAILVAPASVAATENPPTPAAAAPAKAKGKK